MSLIVLKNGESARRLEPMEFPAESSLQEFIAEHPEALPLQELRSDLQFLIVARELPTGSGRVDAVGLDEEGLIYLIETKLFKNPDKRQVLAQVLDYGAALWRRHGDPRDLREELSNAAAKLFGGQDLDDRLRATFELEDEDLAELWSNVESSARDGRFRFIVLMDSLDDRLRDLISYINENSRFDLYGVELELYEFDEYQALLPRIHGAEARKVVTNGKKTWNEQRFFADAETRMPPEVVAACRKLYEFVSEHADSIGWGGGKVKGSFNPKYDAVSPKSVLSVFSQGRIRLNFIWLHGTDGSLSPKVKAFAEKLRELDGWTLPANYEEHRVLLPPDIWSPQVGKLIGAMREAFG